MRDILDEHARTFLDELSVIGSLGAVQLLHLRSEFSSNENYSKQDQLRFGQGWGSFHMHSCLSPCFRGLS